MNGGGACGRAAESAALGYGGDSVVSAATGLSRTTIRAGRLELASGLTRVGRIRRPGAGRPAIEQTQPGVTEALDLLVEPLTRGDPMSPLRWTCKNTGEARRGVDHAGLAGQRHDRRAIAARAGLSVARLAEGAGRRGASRSQCPVRTYQCDGRRVHRARATGDLGRHEEEGIGRGLQAGITAWRCRRARTRCWFR